MIVNRAYSIVKHGIKARIFLMALSAVCLACGSADKRQEGIFGGRLSVYDRIDLMELPYEATDEEYDSFIKEKIERRAIFLLAAYGDNVVSTEKNRSEMQKRLQERKFQVKITSQEDDGSYVYVWATVDLSFFGDIINEDAK